MNKRERLALSLSGGTPDRVPYGFFGHFYAEEQSAWELARKLVEFCNAYDMDYLKIHARYQILTEIWGCKWQYGSDRFAGPSCIAPVIKSTSDLAAFVSAKKRTEPIDELVQLVQFINKELSNDTPKLFTVFSPLLVFGTLMGDTFGLGAMKALISADPVGVKKCLTVITETIVDLMRRVVAVGVDGIFYAAAPFPATGWLDEAGYKEFENVFAYDILSEFKGLSCNMIHLSGGNVKLDLVEPLPAHVVHWLVNKPGNPSIKEGLKLTSKAVSGGTDEQVDFLNATPEKLRAQTRNALEESAGRRHMFAVLLSGITEKVSKEQYQAVIDEIRK